MTGTATILRGNALTLPLADASVDLIVTSPPYFGLRSYQDGGEHYAGQIGSEPTPAEFVDALLAATAEMMRVLKPSGSLWVNLGDKYAQAEERSRNGNGNRKAIDNFPAGSVLRGPTVTLGRKDNGSVLTKSLIGMPWRYAIACIDQLGLILRAEVIWAKPNGLPESVTDRVRRSHETWFHFVRQPRYFSAVDEIREEHKPGQSPAALSFARNGRGTSPGQAFAPHRLDRDAQGINPLGKLPGSVWSIPTQPLTVPPELGVDHFAAFPMEWPRRIIQGWSPSGVCTACGEGRRPVTEVQPQPGLDGELLETRRREPSDEQARQIADFIRAHREAKGMTRRDVDDACGTNTSCSWWEGRAGVVQLPGPVLWRRLSEVLDLPQTWDHLMLDTYMRPTGKLTSGSAAVSGRHQTAGSTGLRSSATITGYACACPDTTAPTTPAVILDPFGGTGTVALVAKALGRHGISLDMSADYCRLAGWRTTDEGEYARALQVEKPAKQVDGQLSLLEAWA